METKIHSEIYFSIDSNFSVRFVKISFGIRVEFLFYFYIYFFSAKLKSGIFYFLLIFHMILYDIYVLYILHCLDVSIIYTVAVS